MGQACSAQKSGCCSVRTGENTLVTGTADYDVRPPGITRSRSAVHLLICALDYKKTKHPLSCSEDARNVQKMIKSCGIEDVKVMLNEECILGAVKAEMKKMARRCGRNDFWVFYFAGHGTRIRGSRGDDEAFCFLNQKGLVGANSLLTDDDFARTVNESLPEDVNVLILADCYHSSTVVDLRKPAWTHRSAIAMTGCSDQQTSQDIGVGGIFTHAMLLAMEKLSKDSHYSVGKLYNTTIKENNRVFHGAQSITLECSDATGPNLMPWPFCPHQSYESPMRSAKNKSLQTPYKVAGPGGAANRDIDIGDYKDVPDDLAQWAKDNDIDLGSDYEDDELENGWKPGKKLLDDLHGSGVI